MRFTSTRAHAHLQANLSPPSVEPARMWRQIRLQISRPPNRLKGQPTRKKTKALFPPGRLPLDIKEPTGGISASLQRATGKGRTAYNSGLPTMPGHFLILAFRRTLGRVAFRLPGTAAGRRPLCGSFAGRK